MTDEKQAAASEERPVQPQVIDLEAEEVERPREAPEGENSAEDHKEKIETRRPYLIITAARIVGIAAVVLVLGAAVYAAFLRMEPGAAGRIGAVDSRLAALEKANERVELGLKDVTAALTRLNEEQSRASGSFSEAELAPLKQQLGEIEERLARVSEAVEGITLSINAVETGQETQRSALERAVAGLNELQSRIAPGGGQPAAAPASNGSALAAALLRLKTAEAEGRRFDEEVEAIRGIAPEARGLSELAQFAPNGVANIADLANRLEGIIGRLRAPAAEAGAAPQPSGLWDMFKAKAAALVSVRKLGDARWLDAAEEALRRLRSGDVEGAVLALNSVDGARPPEIESWLVDASARLEADRAVEELSASVLQQLGGGS